MKRFLAPGGILLLLLSAILLEFHSPNSAAEHNPALDGKKALGGIREESEMLQEQFDVDLRWRIADGLSRLYGDIDKLNKDAQSADRDQLVHQADTYQVLLKHPPSSLIRSVLLTHKYVWIESDQPQEQLEFNSSGDIKGPAFFKDAHWDMVGNCLFINHVGWAGCFWYYPPERRFQGQLIRDNRLSSSIPGDWIWNAAIPYSTIDIRPTD